MDAWSKLGHSKFFPSSLRLLLHVKLFFNLKHLNMSENQGTPAANPAAGPKTSAISPNASASATAAKAAPKAAPDMNPAFRMMGM